MSGKKLKLIAIVLTSVVCLPFVARVQTGDASSELVAVNFRIHLLSGRIIEVTKNMSHSELERLLDELRESLWHGSMSKFNKLLIERLLKSDSYSKKGSSI